MPDNQKEYLMKFKSVAQWPLCCGISLETTENVSKDKHATAEAAISSCQYLIGVGFGGNGEIFPYKTWVEECNADGEVLRKHHNLETYPPTIKIDRIRPTPGTVINELHGKEFAAPDGYMYRVDVYWQDMDTEKFRIYIADPRFRVLINTSCIDKAQGLLDVILAKENHYA